MKHSKSHPFPHGSNAGRPPHFKTPQELQDKINDFFANCPDKRSIYDKQGVKIGEVPELTITGLALHLGFCDRHSFYDYEKYPEFSHTIKKARSLIEREYEILLKNGLGAGAIFALKNFKWFDAPAVEPDNNLDEELEFKGMPGKEVNGKYKRFYN